MTLDEAEDRISRLIAQNLVLRDYLIWVLARDIGRDSDPQSAIRLADQLGEHRISALPAETPEDLKIFELFQSEKDALIGEVTHILRNLKKI